MTWTFGNDPSDPLDAVRLNIGDFVSTRQIIEDEVINGLLTEYGNDVGKTSTKLLDVLIARYSSYGGRTKVGRFELDASYMVNMFKELKKGLEDQMSSGGGLFWSGGQSLVERELDDTDQGLIQPRFVRDQHKNWD